MEGEEMQVGALSGLLGDRDRRRPSSRSPPTLWRFAPIRKPPRSARVGWTTGLRANLKLRDDLYTIGQMEEHSIMRFFDICNHDGVWEHIDLNEIIELFRVFVVGDVNRALGVGRIKAPSVVASQKPVRM